MLGTLEWAAEQAAGSAWKPFQLSDTLSTWTVSEEDEGQPYSPTSERLQRGFLPPVVEGSTEKPSEGRSSVGEPIQPTPGGEVASAPGAFLPMRDLASALSTADASDSLDLGTESSIWKAVKLSRPSCTTTAATTRHLRTHTHTHTHTHSLTHGYG